MDRPMPALRALFALVVLAPVAADATVPIIDDAVGGSCKKMVEYQQRPGVGLDGQHFPARWGITVPNLLIGKKRVDDPSAIDEVVVEPGPTTRERGKVCVATKSVTIDFSADTRVGVIEWLHGQKPKACIDEWNRVRNIIRTHEPKHVKDVEDVVAAANARVASHAALKACAANEDAAKTAIALQIRKLVQTEVARIKREAEAKARALDAHESAFMNCKPCEGGLAFNDVTIDCSIPTPRCTMRTGQKLSGKVCGDPTSATWKITPHYFAEGCGMPATGNKGDKPFDNDCVAEGSPEEKRRADVYRNARGSGAGGWMCVYRDGDQPKIIIRNFRMSMCGGAAEQTVVVDAESADCDQ